MRSHWGAMWSMCAFDSFDHNWGHGCNSEQAWQIWHVCSPWICNVLRSPPNVLHIRMFLICFSYDQWFSQFLTNDMWVTCHYLSFRTCQRQDQFEWPHGQRMKSPFLFWRCVAEDAPREVVEELRCDADAPRTQPDVTTMHIRPLESQGLSPCQPDLLARIEDAETHPGEPSKFTCSRSGRRDSQGGNRQVELAPLLQRGPGVLAESLTSHWDAWSCKRLRSTYVSLGLNPFTTQW